MTIPVEAGHYYHFGIRFYLEILLQRYGPDSLPLALKLATNIDGLPLTKSNNSQFWEILCRWINWKRSQVVAVGIYQGNKKPKDANVYLKQFVDEALQLSTEGLTIKGKKISICFSVFVCDSPASAFILRIIYHTGFFFCTTCATKGVYFKVNKALRGRVTFPQVDAPLGTDSSFRRQTQQKHHHGKSILEQLGIDILKSFPCEPYHLFDIGMMRQLLVNWLIFCPMKGIKLSQIEIEELNNRLLTFKRSNIIPKEFARVPRTLEEIGRWKGSELKQFRKYTGSVLLRGILPEKVYNNFLVFHVASRYVNDPEAVQDIDVMQYCTRLFKIFIGDAKKIYGQQFLCNNAHKLYHFSYYALVHGVAQNFSAEDFENYNQI